LREFNLLALLRKKLNGKNKFSLLLGKCGLVGISHYSLKIIRRKIKRLVINVFK